MQTRIRFDELVQHSRLPVLAVELELPAGFAHLPVDEQRSVVEQGLAHACETTARILDRRRVGAA